MPSISKIFEYILLEQLTNHFIENKLLSPQQYGFRDKHSTELAALNLVDHLTYKLDNGIIPINIYIDQSKAFDTLIHRTLLDKLSYYGINGVAKNLLQSYLSHRHQFVNFNGFTSDTGKISIRNNAIDKVKSTKFLGVIIEDKLKWTEHKYNILKIKYLNLLEF